MITHERREALLQLITDALKDADNGALNHALARHRKHREGSEPSRSERTGWFSDELCEAHSVVHKLLSDWVRDAEEYLDQRADVDDGRPNAAMRLLTDLREVFAYSLPAPEQERLRPEQGDPNEGVR